MLKQELKNLSLVRWLFMLFLRLFEQQELFHLGCNGVHECVQNGAVRSMERVHVHLLHYLK